MKTIHKGQLAVALGVAALGIAIFVGASFIPDAAGYSTVGPAAIPRLVAVGLLVAAAALLWEVLRGGFRHHDEAAERALPTHWAAFIWISVAILSYGILIEHAGFILSSVLLYVLTAAGFGSRRWGLNAAIGAVIAVIIYVAFQRGLGLSLPAGVFKGLL
ncbi:MAG TPA: tripartite tricarboxylate transporter TctB family protein [Casimicrobium sp.]|nr:tripartite tricarboxylate transporter TctB family protein [Casimicrobium sp.]